ncbi:hypothetical protein AYL99_04281 [Fonsecaea erecta]|uniref:Uncharacterized protein n=1 Tax=Fonsecaea erecta TaxID=1367422 RepID=A0A178ZQG4_9EURO|nr:hypothetical protein AYL99_04281 [Fonsecaea erecta]OAP62078.1 hypothetical protein AYL99_04281 [Fonsecaea erecta]
MSSPPSALGWVSSSNWDEPQAVIEVEAKLPVWQNSWTPINPLPTSTIAALPALPPPPSDINDSEESFISASLLREAILDSALRLEQRRRGRTRKALSAVLLSLRRAKRVTYVSSGDASKGAMLLNGNKKTPPKKPRAVGKPYNRQFEIDQSLMPIARTTFNIVASGHKRTSSEAFSTDVETFVAKKMLTMRGMGQGTTSVATGVFMAQEQHTTPMKPTQPDTKRHFAAVDASNRDNQEDLFDDDDFADIENFLEAEKTLVARTTYPTPTSSRPETFRALKTPSSPTEANVTAPMKPVIGPLPSLASPTGLPTNCSALHPFPICLGIGEALRHVSLAFSSSPPATPARAGTGFWITTTTSLNLEIYAVVHTTRTMGASRTVTLADLYFPDRPPYLTGTTVPQPASGAATGPAFSQRFPDRSLVRVFAQISPKPVFSGALTALGTNAPQISSWSPGVNTLPVTAAEKHDVDVIVLSIRRSDWEEIQRVKDICDRASGALTTTTTSTTTPGMASVSTTTRGHSQQAKAEVAGKTRRLS